MAGKGQPRKTRSEETAKQVLKMAQLGVPHERIAHKVALSTVVLRRLYAEELEQGNIDAEIALSNTAFRLATDPQNPDKAMIMFLLKTRFGYRETERKEVSAEVLVRAKTLQDMTDVELQAELQRYGDKQK